MKHFFNEIKVNQPRNVSLDQLKNLQSKIEASTNPKEQKLLALQCAEKVLFIFEEKHPNDKRPRKAIEAVKKYLADQTYENKAAAITAIDAAYAADAEAYTTDINDAATYAVYTAAYTAAAAYNADDDDADYVYNTAAAAYNAAETAIKAFKLYNNIPLNEIKVNQPRYVSLDQLENLESRIKASTNPEEKISLAIQCAEKVLFIFEKEYPNDKRPRQAIEAVKKYLADPTEENKAAASADADASSDAANEATYATAAWNAANAATSTSFARFAHFVADDAIKAFKLYNNINEIKVNQPTYLSSNITSEVRKHVISYILDEINFTSEKDMLSYYFESSIYDIFKSFIIDQMVFNNHEILKNGEEILVSHNDESIINEQDIKDYIDSKPELEKYLKQLMWKFYYDNVDINEIYREALNQAQVDKKDFDDDGENYNKWDIERSVDRAINNLSFSYYLGDIIYENDNDFKEFLEKEFLQTDLIKENMLLREYPESKIKELLTKWGIDPVKDPTKANIARKHIERFDNIKRDLPDQKDILVIPNELKNKDLRNIDIYSFEELDKLITSYPESDKKIKADAIKKFVDQEKIDRNAALSYVSRFMNNRDNLRFGTKEGTADYTKEEVLNYIPKRLIPNQAFVDPRNWNWQQFEQMLDALFPSYKKVENEENTAETNADIVYNKDGIEIYKGDDVHKCISYNPVITKGDTNRKKYSWCVTQVGNTNYDYYRLGDKSPTFYFVFDRNKPSSPDHQKFDDKWHAFVIQVTADKKTYLVTSADNDRDAPVDGWENISTLVPSDTWARIKNLKDYFKPIALSPAERGKKMAKGLNLTVDEFKELPQLDKIDYVVGKSADSKLPNSILEILPKYKLTYEGKSTNLAFIAIDGGQKFPYYILKDNEQLAKRYAIVRFRYKNSPVPLPYIKYLDDKSKQDYIEKYNTPEQPYLTFEYIEKYFGEKYAKEYVDKAVKNLEYLPPAAVKYISNPKLKKLFEIYSKLFSNWQFTTGTNLSDEQLINTINLAEQTVDPRPINQNDWGKLSTSERKDIIELSKRYDGNTTYSTLLYALPYVIKDGDKYYALLPEKNIKDRPYDSWVLADENNNVIKSDISGSINLGGAELNSGYPEFADGIYNRVYDIKELNSQESLDEVVYKALNEFIKTKNY